MAFYNEEYKDLLAAQRVVSRELKGPTEESLASLASALVKVIDQKRIMRGQAAPRPLDLSKKKRKRPTTSAPSIPTDIPAATAASEQPVEGAS